MDARTAMARAVRHAANNMLMAAQGNLELIARAAAADPRQALRAERALGALRELRALLDAQAQLLRDDLPEATDAAALLDGLRPVLAAVAAGRATLAVETDGAAAQVALPRPAYELALVMAAHDAVATGGDTLHLRLLPEGVAVNDALVPFSPRT
jgi:hypothetical protein